MPYISDQEFEDAFGQREAQELQGDGNSFARAEAAACSLIDGYMGGRYALPLSNVPAIVKGWALDITRYRLWDQQAPDEVRRRYDDALAQLKLLAAGTISLPPGLGGPAQVSGSGVAYYSDCRVFDQCSLRGF